MKLIAFELKNGKARKVHGHKQKSFAFSYKSNAMIKMIDWLRNPEKKSSPFKDHQIPKFRFRRLNRHQNKRQNL
jgi:hypothetical protein